VLPQQQGPVKVEAVLEAKETPAASAAACGRASEEVLELLQLVRFALMSEAQLQVRRLSAVLSVQC
jgi:hypothetical protein